MKKWFLVFISLSALLILQSIELSGTIDDDFEITANNSPYHIIGNVTFSNSCELVIEAGSEIVFTGYFLFTVNGPIIATGNSGTPIEFRSSDSSINQGP